jgi:putative flippase GtrA
MTLPQPSRSLGERLQRAWRERGIHLKAVSFALIGVVNFTVDFSVFTFGYYYLGLPIVVANVISWLVAVSGSYVMNSMITFAAESGRRLRVKDYATFAGLQTGGLVANTLTVYLLSFFIPVLVGKVIAIGASFLVNFSLSHFVVFRRRTSTEP